MCCMFTVTNLGGCVQKGVDFVLVYISAYGTCFENSNASRKRLTHGQGHLPTWGERTRISLSFIFQINDYSPRQANICRNKAVFVCLTATFLTFNAFPQAFVMWSRSLSSSVLSFLIWSLPLYCSTSLPFGAGEAGTPGFSYSLAKIKSLRDDNDYAAMVREWETTECGDSTPPWSHCSPLSWINHAEMCGITLTGGTWTLRLPACWWGQWSQRERLWKSQLNNSQWRRERGRPGKEEKQVDDRLMWGRRRDEPQALLLWAWSRWWYITFALSVYLKEEIGSKNLT